MRWILALPLLTALATYAAAQTTQPTAPAQTDVPVKVVVLYSSGVGYFEHFGTVKGDASTELRFKTQQINDILKSLLLQDLDGGKVSTVTYPSQDPVSKILRSFQVDITANPSLADLLNQLRGAKVQVLAQGQQQEGTILSVEKKAKATEKGNIEVPVLNLISGGTIRSIELDQVTKLELLDPQLQQELGKALEALAQARDQDKKPVSIKFSGAGDRRVKVGYVVETPVWKTSYRLVLPVGEEKPKLLGWAIVENQTDNDWSNVQLSLVSGRPISFIQDLYQPLYIPRPVVQPELYASLRPQTYEGGLDRDKLAEAKPMEMENRARATARPAARSSGASALKQAQDQTATEMGGLALADAPAGGTAGDGAYRRGIDASASVASVASAAKLGELFQYTVGNVSLPRQRSAMIPIITDDVEVERLSIYNQSVLAKNPLNGARVKNTTKKHLLQGPVTVLDDNAYAGDARIDNVPPGQERLLSYGIDLQVLVNPTTDTTKDQVLTGKIVKGVMFVTHKYVQAQTYLAENKGEKDKTLLIEHPVHQGWKLVETDKPIETTEAVYRFQGKLEAGKVNKLTIKEENVSDEQFAILGIDPGVLAVYARTGQIPQPVRDALTKAIQLKQALADTQRQITEKQQQLAQITAEQQRIRENMKTVAQNSDYYQRLLTKLNEQETKIEKLQGEVDTLQKTMEQQRKALEDYVNNLQVS